MWFAWNQGKEFLGFLIVIKIFKNIKDQLSQLKEIQHDAIDTHHEDHHDDHGGGANQEESKEEVNSPGEN